MLIPEIVASLRGIAEMIVKNELPASTSNTTGAAGLLNCLANRIMRENMFSQEEKQKMELLVEVSEKPREPQ